MGDHPRIRGEHVDALGRGPRGPGIIPAYAGSTLSTTTRSGRWRGSSPHTRGALGRARPRSRGCWDHPRIRGEHSCMSYPPSWGFGIIPAYAGSTDRLRRLQDPQRGSSPHTRGALPLGIESIRVERIIPAYAGSTVVFQVQKPLVSGSSPHTRGARTARTCSAS